MFLKQNFTTNPHQYYTHTHVFHSNNAHIFCTTKYVFKTHICTKNLIQNMFFHSNNTHHCCTTKYVCKIHIYTKNWHQHMFFTQPIHILFAPQNMLLKYIFIQKNGLKTCFTIKQ